MPALSQLTFLALILAVLPCCQPAAITTADPCQDMSMPDGCKCRSDSGPRVTCIVDGLPHFPAFNQIHLQVNAIRVEGMNTSYFKGGAFFGWNVRKMVLRNDSIQYISDLAFWGLEFQLEVLDLSHNLLDTVPSNALRTLRSLRILKLSHNKIKYLREREFKYMAGLRILFLDSNPIYHISLYSFVGSKLYVLVLDSVPLQQQKKTDGKLQPRLASLPTHDFHHLRVLSLANTSLRKVPAGWFKRCHSLRNLNLNNNKLKKLHPKSFKGLGDTLQTLGLNNNKLVRIPKSALLSLNKLKYLEISGNRFDIIKENSFQELSGLITLDLRHNGIHSIDTDAFVGLNSLEILDLRFNAIETLYKETITVSSADDFKIYLSHNAWVCDCNVSWMHEELPSNMTLADLDLLRCSFPAEVQGLLLQDIPETSMIQMCDHKYYEYYGHPDYYQDDYPHVY